MTGGAGTSFAEPERDHVNLHHIYLAKLKSYTPSGLAPTIHDVAIIRTSVYGSEQGTIHAIFPDYIEALSLPGPPPGTICPSAGVENHVLIEVLCQLRICVCLSAFQKVVLKNKQHWWKSPQSNKQTQPNTT